MFLKFTDKKFEKLPICNSSYKQAQAQLPGGHASSEQPTCLSERTTNTLRRMCLQTDCPETNLLLGWGLRETYTQTHTDKGNVLL